MTTISLIAPTGVLVLGAPTNVVDIHDLHVVQDTHPVLYGISSNIPSDQMVAPTGVNGPDRSTLLHALFATAPIIRGPVRPFGADN